MAEHDSTIVQVRYRLWLLAPAIAALVCGVLSGLARLGVAMPDAISGLAGVHGALMVGGFFGTVISLERAVALSKPWPYLAPLFSGIAALAMLGGVTTAWPAGMLAAAAAVMTLACFSVWRRQPDAHHAVLTVAALCWLAGNLQWLASGAVLPAVPLWSAFLLLTIAAERLELSRMAPTPQWARRVFAVLVIVTVAGTGSAAIAPDVGLRGYAAGLLGLALWFGRFDIARRTVRIAGLTRYIAICLLAGFFWLGVGGLLGMSGALQPGADLRDAALHALLLGFVFSMVFGHAPIILPAVSGQKFSWHRGFYLALFLLQAGVALRVFAGLAERFDLRRFAGVANGAALALFMLMVAGAVVAGRRQTGNRRVSVEYQTL